MYFSAFNIICVILSLSLFNSFLLRVNFLFDAILNNFDISCSHPCYSTFFLRQPLYFHMDFGDLEFNLRSNGDMIFSSIHNLVIASILISIYSLRWYEFVISLKFVIPQASIDRIILYEQKKYSILCLLLI